MARTRNKLTASKVSSVSGRSRHGDGAGLWLNVSSSGSKSWVFRWSPKGGAPREMGLGAYPAVSLARARDLAQTCREHVAMGKDPKAERDRLIGNTFGQAADAYLEAMGSKWTNAKTQWQWQSTLQDRCASIRSRPVAQVDTADVLKVLNPIWQKIPETASRTRMRIEAVLDYAKANGWREGENPARWRGHLQNILPAREKHAVKHHPAMDYANLPAFILELRQQRPMSARALELLILTATRTSEVLNATWDEFDLGTKIWTIPASRMKAKRDHRIPLSSFAMELLTTLAMDRVSDFVFPGQKLDRPLSNMAMEMVLRRMGYSDITVHGFRSTFRDWCGDQTDFPREIAEAALAHTVGTNVELAYRRSDALEKRRMLMEEWGQFVG